MSGPESDHVAYIKPFLDSISGQEDESAFTYFERDEESKIFHRAFIMPRACINAWVHSPRILAIDACHFKSQTPSHILGASFLNANRHILFLSWGVSTDNENRETWETFFQFLMQAFDFCGLEYSA